MSGNATKTEYKRKKKPRLCSLNKPTKRIVAASRSSVQVSKAAVILSKSVYPSETGKTTQSQQEQNHRAAYRLNLTSISRSSAPRDGPAIKVSLRVDAVAYVCRAVSGRQRWIWAAMEWDWPQVLVPAMQAAAKEKIRRRFHRGGYQYVQSAILWPALAFLAWFEACSSFVAVGEVR